MLKKISFIISSFFQSLKSEENFTVDSVLRNARKSQSMYDGMYHITEDLLKISDSTINGSCVVLSYVSPSVDGDGEDMHLFIIHKRKIFYFYKDDEEDTVPTFQKFKDYEAPILLQLEITTRKNSIYALKANTIFSHIETANDIPEHLEKEWAKMVTLAKEHLIKHLPEQR